MAGRRREGNERNRGFEGNLPPLRGLRVVWTGSGGFALLHPRLCFAWRRGLEEARGGGGPMGFETGETGTCFVHGPPGGRPLPEPSVGRWLAARQDAAPPEGGAAVEGDFPMVGKRGGSFSNGWKKWGGFFQWLEKVRAVFPTIGKTGGAGVCLAEGDGRGDGGVGGQWDSRRARRGRALCTDASWARPYQGEGQGGDGGSGFSQFGKTRGESPRRPVPVPVSVFFGRRAIIPGRGSSSIVERQSMKGAFP